MRAGDGAGTEAARVCVPQKREKESIKNLVITKTFMIDLLVILFMRAI